MSPSFKGRRRTHTQSYRSGLEVTVAAQLDAAKVAYEYEELVLKYTVPAKVHRYTPDFHLLSNGIIVETKGEFTSQDRAKMLYIKEQYPHLDIRLVFTRSKQTISKRSKTTYADWCQKHGFQYADKQIPHSWLYEPPKEKKQ